MVEETLHDQVAGRVRDLIVEGALEPGSWIDGTRLLERRGVSRTPFREALRTLAAEGLVVIRPSRGSVVRELDAGEIFSMLVVLDHLERLGAGLACERAQDAEVEAVIALHGRMMRLHAARDRLARFELDREFHPHRRPRRATRRSATSRA